MRSRLVTVSMVVVVLLLGAVSLAWADDCETLIQQAREALEQFRRAPGPAGVKDARIASAEIAIRSAQGAHDAGEHAEGVRQATAALRTLGR